MADEPLADRACYSIDEFCAAHRVSRRKFYDLLEHGLGPRLMRVGSRILISVEAAAAWRREREMAGEAVA
jgi:hypothetical protein